jgi:hypothetical protein
VSTVNVTARRWARGWELHIADADGSEIGVTQSRTLAGAEAIVRDYLELDDRAAPDHVDIQPELDGDIGSRAAAARRKVREAAEVQVAAAEQSREVARQLKEAGLSGADVGAVLGVSAQRVSQLLVSKEKAAAAKAAKAAKTAAAAKAKAAKTARRNAAAAKATAGVSRKPAVRKVSA